jgi:DNA-binding CsgD family transcriptional regulator
MKRTKLSAQEINVLRQLSVGHTVAQIARALGISVFSVRTYVMRAKRKLNAKTGMHMMAVAVSRRVVELHEPRPVLIPMPTMGVGDYIAFSMPKSIFIAAASQKLTSSWD